MGKNKKKSDDKKAALQARKDAKAQKAAQKRLAKEQGNEAADGDEDQLDDLLEVYRKQDEQVNTTVLEPLESFPIPRGNATLTLTDDKNGHLYLFGGEYYDGVSNVILDDLLRWDPSKSEASEAWKRIVTPAPRPPPRCAHSTVFYKQFLYLFGGELANSDEYHHYKDIWRFDTKSNKWEEIQPRNTGTPCSARSGHVAFVWKHYMIIFGGFYEALRDTRWFNDVCVLDLQTHTWLEVPYSKLATRPEARSAANVGIHGDMAVIQGGYSKLKNPTAKAEARVHTDAWALHLKPLLQNKPPTWEKLSIRNQKSAASPQNRSGTASVTYKNRMLVYGGVVDEEQYHHKVDSVFYNDLFALDMDRRKWFPIKVKQQSEGKSRRRRKRDNDDQEDGENQAEKVQEEDDDEEANDSSDFEEADESEVAAGWDIDMLRSNMFAFVDGNGNIVYEKIEEEVEVDKAAGYEADAGEGHKAEEEKEEEKKEVESDEEKEEEKEAEKVVEMMKQPKKVKIMVESNVMKVNNDTGVPEAVMRAEPLPRIKAAVVVRNNVLYIYGGILEVGDREVTLDDCWTFDLRKRDKWECVWEGTMHKQVWRGAIHDDDDSYISTGAEGEESDDSDFGSDTEEMDEEGKKAAKKAKSKAAKKEKQRAGLRQEIADLKAKLDLDDADRTPNAGESMADFYSRTSEYWTEQAAAALAKDGSREGEQLSHKEMKREGFSYAQERYDELRPVLDRLNELDLQQQEAESGKKRGKSEKKQNKKEKKDKRR